MLFLQRTHRLPSYIYLLEHSFLRSLKKPSILVSWKPPRVLNNVFLQSTAAAMTKLPLLPKHTGPEHVDVIPQTMPYRHPTAGASTAGNPSAARHRPNGAIDTTHTAPDISAQPTHACPHPPGSLNDCYEDEAYHLEGDAKQNYPRNMLLLAADVKERITSRGRHAHGRLHDSKLADSVRNLEKLVGCFVSALVATLTQPLPPSAPPSIPYAQPAETSSTPLSHSPHRI